MIGSKPKDRKRISVFLTGMVVMICLAAPVSGWLSQDILDQIERSREDVQKIKDSILTGDQKHQTYDRLATLGDKFHARLCGSDALEESLDYVSDEMNKEGITDVHFENVIAPKWTRGNEYAEILEPLRRKMPILALGSSVGTNGVKLTAEAIVVKSFDELKARNDVAGKIVVYNQPWQGPGISFAYKTNGASEAARKGAVGALVRSVTDFSIYSLHTGPQVYAADVTKIPVACITVEDAELLQRHQDRNETIRVSMYTEAQNPGNIITRNLVADIKGTEFPDQVVIFGGHIDAWDVGTGSMDDGGGLMISWQALSVINSLNLAPRRTLRVVLWTCEEFGHIGGQAYYNAHQNDSDKLSLIMESDHGVFNPKGLNFSGSGLARAIMEEILKNLSDINTVTVVNGGGSSPDTGLWIDQKGVPGAELYSADEDYFFFHHSNGDTMTVLDRDELDRATILWATAVYSVANLDEILPREGEYPVA